MSYGKHPILMAGLLVALPVLAASAELATPPGVIDVLYPASTASAAETESHPNDSSVGDQQAGKDLGEIEKRLDLLEARLGKSPRPPSLANSVERRLADLESRIQKLEQQQKQMQKWEQRIRRLEKK